MDIHQLRQLLPKYNISIDGHNRCKFVILVDIIAYAQFDILLGYLDKCKHIHDTYEMLVEFLIFNNYKMNSYGVFVSNNDTITYVYIHVCYFSICNKNYEIIETGNFDEVTNYLRNVLNTDSLNKLTKIEY